MFMIHMEWNHFNYIASDSLVANKLNDLFDLTDSRRKITRNLN